MAFEAADTSKVRKSPGSRPRAYDSLLPTAKRDRLSTNVQDIAQNYSIAAWAIRRHLDYVSSFTFQARTGDDGLNRELESLVDWYSRPGNCHVAGRHSLGRLVRLSECCRVIDGDIFAIKLGSGHLQMIESDRVRDPDESDESWTNGVQATKSGRLKAISVHRRDSRRGYEFERVVQGANVIHLGYFDRFDQVRGVSPLAAAVNTFRDTYEGFGYALAKAKVAQLFGLVISRQSSESMGDYEAVAGAEDSEEADGPRYEIKFGDGPVKLELEEGDDAKFLESGTPPMEFQAFQQVMVGAALKALDLPYSFYDEAHTNFFGSRAALIHYIKSAKSKRADIQEYLGRITGWRLAKFVADGTLSLPSGLDLTSLKWDWVPDGVEWWNPQQEIGAAIEAINNGLTTRTDVVRERTGRDWKDIVDQLAAENEYLESKGVILTNE